jgi:HSP20 family protein
MAQRTRESFYFKMSRHAISPPFGEKNREATPPSEEPASCSPFEKLRREMERIFEEAGSLRRGALGSWGKPGWLPRCNVYESRDRYTVLVDLAGVDKERLDIRADSRTLYLRGEREEPVPPAAERCHQLEISVGIFDREIPLPGPIDPERVSVRFAEGWLEITLPKLESLKVPIEEPHS